MAFLELPMPYNNFRGTHAMNTFLRRPDVKVVPSQIFIYRFMMCLALCTAFVLQEDGRAIQ